MIPNDQNKEQNQAQGGNNSNSSNSRLDEKLRTNTEDYKNIETAVNNPNYFDDDFAVKQEEAFIQDDQPNDNDNRVGTGTGEG